MNKDVIIWAGSFIMMSMIVYGVTYGLLGGDRGVISFDKMAIAALIAIVVSTAFTVLGNVIANRK